MLFMLAGIAFVAAVGLISSPASASAETTTYCGGNQPAGGFCLGAWRSMHQAYGWGDQGGVCVGIFEYNKACTSGKGTGVYSPSWPSNGWARPAMWNNFGGTNFVHGIALS